MILEYLYNNQEYFKEKVYSVTCICHTAVSTDPLFKEDIDKQYKSNVSSIIANDVTKRLAVPIEDVLIILEGINLKEYLK